MLAEHYITFFRNECIKSNNTGARMLDSSKKVTSIKKYNRVWGVKTSKFVRGVIYFCNELNKATDTKARMLDFIYHLTMKLL